MSRTPTLQIKFTMQAAVVIGDTRLDVVELQRCLRVIADTQSITEAARMLAVTYRTLWGRLQAYDQAFNVRLVGKSRGRGTSLTGKGRALLAALERHSELFAPPAVERINALAFDLSRTMGEQPLLRLLASHDYAIARALARTVDPSEVPEQPAFAAMIHAASAGSDDCVRALLRGDVDLAGYHHPDVDTEAASHPQWQRVEHSEAFWSVALMTREQGLIVAPHKKNLIKSLADLAQPDVRFVNRQRGSGTRLLLDTLLANARISPTKITGYEQEEFTHQAVAATIAAGAADAGLGLRAAAAQFKLHFIPLAVETYWLAGRLDTQANPAVTQLIASVRAAAANLPGYRPVG